MKKKYKAKFSYGMLIAIFLLFFAVVIFVIAHNGIKKEFYILIGILLPSYAFILNMFLTTEYTIENEFLRIKCGILFNKKIDIHKIKKISRTNSLMSSPAPSFDRIEIKYGKFDEIILSPEDKFNFAKDLTILNSVIENNITEN